MRTRKIPLKKVMACLTCCCSVFQALPAGEATRLPTLPNPVTPAISEPKMRQQDQTVDETGPLGLAHVLEYNRRRSDGKYFWQTNMEANWWGVWKEDTNTGWRVNLCLANTNASDVGIIIKVGSVVMNSGVGFLPTPDGKFAKLELVNLKGEEVATKKGAATKLFQEKYLGSRIVNTHLSPSEGDATVERRYPETIPDLEYPRWSNGSFVRFTGFTSNGPPCHIGYFKLHDIFSIKLEGDYILTVQPVLYRMRYEGGTFQGYLDRVDLPSISTKVHLVPK